MDNNTIASINKKKDRIKELINCLIKPNNIIFFKTLHDQCINEIGQNNIIYNSTPNQQNEKIQQININDPNLLNNIEQNIKNLILKNLEQKIKEQNENVKISENSIYYKEIQGYIEKINDRYNNAKRNIDDFYLIIDAIDTYNDYTPLIKNREKEANKNLEKEENNKLTEKYKKALDDLNSKLDRLKRTIELNKEKYHQYEEFSELIDDFNEKNNEYKKRIDEINNLINKNEKFKSIEKEINDIKTTIERTEINIYSIINNIDQRNQQINTNYSKKINNSFNKIENNDRQLELKEKIENLDEKNKKLEEKNNEKTTKNLDPKKTKFFNNPLQAGKFSCGVLLFLIGGTTVTTISPFLGILMLPGLILVVHQCINYKIRLNEDKSKNLINQLEAYSVYFKTSEFQKLSEQQRLNKIESIMNSLNKDLSIEIKTQDDLNKAMSILKENQDKYKISDEVLNKIEKIIEINNNLIKKNEEKVLKNKNNFIETEEVNIDGNQQEEKNLIPSKGNNKEIYDKNQKNINNTKGNMLNMGDIIKALFASRKQ